MISFESDYNNGTLPEILEALGKTNDEKTSGYGFDPYTEAAKEKIRKTISDSHRFRPLGMRGSYLCGDRTYRGT